MSLHPLDITIVLGIFSVVLGAAWYSRRYTKSVADFLSANRCGGRYMLTIADGMAGLGAVSIVASWEKYYQGGFASMHWGTMFAPLALVLAMSGWVVYRYRQTRALTLAQFLEMRYSRRFRIFAGFLCFLSGVLNYGIFPAVTGRFMIYFLDLPIYTSTVPGLALELNWTLGAIMALLLGLALLITLNGGQISIMVSDFVQGQLTYICFLMLLVALLVLIPWSDMTRTLETAPPGQSKINPFDQGELPDFSPMFFIMMAVLSIYQYRVWQGSQAFNASATSPHEAKMATVLAGFRSLITDLLLPLSAIAAWVLLNGQVRPDEAAAAHSTLDAITAGGDEQLANQLTTTVAMKELLPIGMLGALASVMIMAAVSTDATYLHSWGSIFVQDVLAPVRQVRGQPKLSPKAHLRTLKWSVFSIAAFAWVFSMVFPVQEYIFMYFQATGAIFTGGAGAVLIGGLYWRRGTTGAAWASMIVGSTLAILGVLTTNVIWPKLLPVMKVWYPDQPWLMNLPAEFWLNGLEIGFAVSVIAILTYVAVSLISPRGAVDFDKLFHRGAYAVDAPEGEPDYVPRSHRGAIPSWLRALGITEEFTLGDKLIFAFKYALFVWAFGVGFLGITLAYVFGFMRSDGAWITWWTINLSIIAVLGAVATVWFLIGGFYDLFAMFSRLKSLRRNVADDGTVVQHAAVVGGERHHYENVAGGVPEADGPSVLHRIDPVSAVK